MVKRKYSKDKLLKKQQQWIIGGIDTESKEALMTMVEKRNTETIENVLETWVRKYSIINTDEWKEYTPAIKNLGFKIIELSAIKKVLWTRKLVHRLRQLFVLECFQEVDEETGAQHGTL